MKTNKNKLAQWIVITGITLCMTLILNSNSYANSPVKYKLIKSDSEKINYHVYKIKNYLELLKTSDANQSEKLHKRIRSSQHTIRKSVNKLSLEAPKNPSANLSLTRNDLNVAENSLSVRKFRVNRNGTTQAFQLEFNTPQIGNAAVEIISPGGELLYSFLKPDYMGRFDEDVELSAADGRIYFININVDGRQTTKKVRFE